MVRAGVDPQAVVGRGGRVVELSEEGGFVLESGFLFSADFVRVGDDLLLRGEDGREVLVRDYFAQDPPPPLETAEGARLLPETVDGLAIPEAPLAYAQAGTVQLAEPIGQVSTLSGSARVQRPDGTRANLSEGDPIFEGDVVSTGVGSELGILFVDDTVFSLSANARMVINELVYNPSSTANSMGISLIQGTFVFITGKVAPSGGIDVETPVGTIGIRGTTVGVQIATFGGRTQIANLTNPETGEFGSFTFSNNVGDALFTLANHFLDVSSATVDPGVPSVASGQAIAREFGRALNRAVEVQRSVSQDQPEDEPEQQNPDETQEGELEVDQLQAVLEEAGLTQEQIEALQTGAPIETAAGPQQGQAGDGGAPSISQGSSLGGSLQTEAVSDDLDGVEELIDGGGTPSGLDPAPPTEGVTTAPPVETVGEETEPPLPPAPPNTPPTVAGGAATVLEGGLVAIGPAAVNASDAETGDPAQLVYTVAAISNGLLVRAVGEGFQVVFSFTQADLDSGSVFFAHDGSETTDAGFTVTVADPDGGVSDPVAIPISVTPQNDPPVLVNNSLNVGEGQAVVLTAENLSAADADDDDAGLVFTVSNVTGGRFELPGGGFQEEGAISAQQAAVTSFTQQQVLDGDVVFVHDGGEAAPGYSVSVGDGEASTEPAPAAIDYTPVNDPPMAEDDGGAGFVTDEDSAFTTASVLGNDSDVEDDPLSVTEVNGQAVTVGQQITLGSGALLTLNADGSFDYDPNGRFEGLGAGDYGEDVFTYRVSDGNDGSDTATATIAVNGVNDPPVAGDDGGAGFVTDEDSAFTTASVLGNDSDVEDDPLSVTEVNGQAVTVGQQITLGSGALLTLNADGSFDYDPNGRFEGLGAGDYGEDVFTYRISDGNEGSDTATATIAVNGVNDPPVLVDNSLSVVEGQTVALSGEDLSATDSDDSDGGLVFTVSDVTGGRFALAGSPETSITSFTQQQVLDGAIVFVDDGDEVPPSYNVSVSDGQASTVPVAAEIDYTPVNDDPVVTSDTAGLVKGTSLAITTAILSASDVETTDPAQLTFTVSAEVAGDILLSGAPAANFTLADVIAGLVTFQHDGSDGAAAGFTVTVSDPDGGVSPPADLSFAVAASFVWTNGGGDGDWNSPLNWASESVPIDGADVVIPDQPGAAIFSSGSAVLQSLTLESESLVITGGSFAVTGELTSEIGSTIALSGGSFEVAGGTLNGTFAWTGGTVTGDGATLTINGPANLGGVAPLTLDIDLDLDGLGAMTGNIQGGGAIENNGSLLVSSATTLGVGFSNEADGTLAVFSNLTIDNGSGFRNSGSITIAAFATLAVVGGDLENAFGAEIGGEGIIDVTGGSLINNGTINPGSSPGTFTVLGDYEQGADGLLTVEIDASGGDLLQVSGTASFAGVIDVVFLNGFVPTAGDTLDFVQATEIIDNGVEVTGIEYAGGLLGIQLSGGVASFVAITGSGDTFVDPFEIIVGDEAFGSLTVDAGQDLGSEYFSVGEQATGIGEFVLTNASTLTIQGPSFIGNAGIGDATISGGAQAVFGSDEADNLVIGNVFGSFGTLLLDGPGTSVTTTGESNRVQVGLEGTGEVVVQNEASLNTLLLDVGVAGTGTFLVSGLGSEAITQVTVSNEVGLFPGDFADRAGVVRVGRDAGGDGTLEVRDGARMEIRAGIGVNEDTNGPTLQIGRDAGSTGSVLIDGTNSAIELTQTAPSDPDNDIFGPFVAVGYAGEGTLEIRNGGKLNLTSEFVDFTAARQETGEGTVLVDGSESAITLTGEGVFASIGREGTGSVTLSNGAKFSLVGGDDDFTRLIVGLENGSVGTLNVRSGSEVYVQGGDANTRLRIGREEGSEGTVTVTGDGSLLDVGGTNANESFDNRIEVGKEGTGTLNTLDGASVVAERLDLGFDPTGIGTALVDDATWEIGAGGLRVGREGDGTLTIQNGGSVIVDEELAIATAGGSSGTLNVLGGGDSTTELTVNEDLIVGAGWFDPNDPDFGSDAEATGLLNIDGAVVTSQSAFVGDGKHGTGEATVDSGEWNVLGELDVGLEGDGTLDIRNGGSVNVAGDYNNIANGGGSAGSVSIDVESSLTVDGKLTVGLGWFDPADDPTFGQSATAAGSLTVNGGLLATQGVDIGGQRLGIGEATVDGGTWTDTSGPENGFAVGQAGDGTLIIRNGGTVTTNGGFNSIGNAGGSRGSVTVDATSSLTYEGFLSVGNGFYDPIEFPGFGRDAEATGILTIEGGTVTAQDADIGGTERGRGFVTIDGDGALFDAGGSLNIGHLGEGTVTLRNGGELQADTVSVGADGSLGGVGLVDGDVFIDGGTVGPGLSPGALQVDGSFTLNDGLLLFEIAGTTPGIGHDVLTVSSPNPGSGNVNLDGGVIQFDFDSAFTPLVSDRFAFLNHASLSVSDHVAYRFTGVDPNNFFYDFFDDVPGTRSLGFFGNSVSLGNGVVFEGGEGDDYEAGSAFADRIDGAEGSDTLGGAGGNDTLTGGDYGDTFVFTLAPLDAGAPGAELTITDFFRGEDVIEIVGWDSTSPDDIGVTGTAYGTMLDFGDGYSIHLDFVYGYVLNPDDFVFRVLAIGEVARNSDNDIVIGSDYGDGRLEIRDGAEVAAQDVVLGGGAEGGGELLVTGSGSKLTSSGEGAIIEIGENAGGDATVSGGANLEGLWINIARNGTGTMTVTDDGTVIDLSNEFGTFSGSGDVDEGAFFRIGRNAGSDGTLKVLSGAVVNIEASPGFNSPGLQIARNHESKGTVLVDGDGSQINITQTDLPDPDNDIFGPYLTLRSGEGDLTIQNDGAVRLFGQDASVSVGRGNADAFGNPGDAPVLQQSVLKILTGGSLTVDGDDGFADLDIGQEANGNGAVEVRGDGSALLLEGLAPTIEVGLGGAGTLLVDQGGRVTATSMGIGRRIGSEGDVTIDGGQDQEVRTELRLIGQHSDGTGAFLQIGREGVGNLSLMGGALLTIDGQGGAFPGFFLGRNADGNGTITADGLGTELIITNGDNAPRGGFGLIGVGREGTGTLEVTQGASVVNAAGGYAFVGREVGSQGEVIVDGVDGTATLFDAGAVLVVGADYDSEEILFDSGGTGSVTVADGGTVRAGAAQGDGITDIFIGSGGTVTVQAGGTLIGDIENVGGTLINGNSPGTAAFGGDFAMSDGVLEVELGGTGAGAFDLYRIAGTADFTGGVIEFSMIEGYDPLAGDSFIFLTAGALALDEDALSFVVRGVDQAFDFALDIGADSLGLTVLNDAGSGEGLVFLGGEGDEAFAGGVGDDRLDGGGGRDSLTGGDGSDIFVLRAADGAESLDLADIIADFEIGSDSLGLAEGLGAEDLTITATEGGDAAVALQSSGAILAVLQGVSAADIDPAEITTVV